MRRLVFGFLAALAIAAPAPAALAQTAPPVATAQASERQAQINAKVFDAVWNRVRVSYYDATYGGLDWEAVRTRYRDTAIAAPETPELYRVLVAMLAELGDAHAAVLTPTQARFESRRDEARPVMGITALKVGQRYVLADVRRGSPAEQAEIELGWELRSLNGRPWFAGTPLTAGTAVTLEFVDPSGTVRPVSITPQLMVGRPRHEAHWAAPGVLVLTFDEFDRGVAGWIDKELDRAPPGTRLILDVRSNRGGLVAEARAVLACFVPKGSTWAISRSRNAAPYEMKVSGGCTPFQGPLAVLVSGASRSAAELVPGALQVAGRATVVGRQTSGNVLISMQSRLPDGGRFNMSVQDVRLADGRRLEHVGVAPDIEAFTTLADRRAGRDPAMDAAVRVVMAQPVAATTATP
jgi:carboxyl-terminal processing protease